MSAAAEDNFWAKVAIPADVMTGCWLWRAGKTAAGYGQFGKGRLPGGSHRAHRLAYWLVIGPVPDGKELDHLCRNRACVNPAHLEPVSHGENVRRGLMANNRHGAKLTAEEVKSIRERYAAGGVLQRELAVEHGIKATTVCNILAGRGWR